LDKDAGSGLILGIESAIEGGSLCLFRGNTEISCVCGKFGLSRAEDLIPTIQSLMVRSRVLPQELSVVVVSLGPGSFTGIKIGIATASGMAAGLRVRCLGVSILTAMATSSENDGRIIAAVPVGRNSVCFQRFDKSGRTITAITSPTLATESDFTDLFQQKGLTFVLHDQLQGRIDCLKATEILITGPNLAKFLINAYIQEMCSEDLKPVFVDREPVALR